MQVWARQMFRLACKKLEGKLEEEFVKISSNVCEISCCDQWLIILAKTICWRIATRKTCAFQKNDNDRQSSSEYACHSNSEKDESNFSNLIQCLNYNRYWISTWNMLCVASCSVHQNICAHHMIKHEWLIYIFVWWLSLIDNQLFKIYSFF